MYGRDGMDEVQEFGLLLEELDDEIRDVLAWKPVPTRLGHDRPGKQVTSLDSLGDFIAVDVSHPEPISDVTEVTINSNGLSISRSGSTEILDPPYPVKKPASTPASKPPVRVVRAAKRIVGVRRVPPQSDAKTAPPARTAAIPRTTKAVSASQALPMPKCNSGSLAPPRPAPRPATKPKSLAKPPSLDRKKMLKASTPLHPSSPQGSIDATSPVNTLDDMMASQCSSPDPEPARPPAVPPLKTSALLEKKIGSRRAAKPAVKPAIPVYARKPSAKAGSSEVGLSKAAPSAAKKSTQQLKRPVRETNTKMVGSATAPTASAAAKVRRKAAAPLPKAAPRRSSSKSTASPYSRKTASPLKDASPLREASPKAQSAASPLQLPTRKASESPAPPKRNVSTSASPPKPPAKATRKVKEKKKEVGAADRYVPSYMRATASTPPKKDKFVAPPPPPEDFTDGRDIFDLKPATSFSSSRPVSSNSKVASFNSKASSVLEMPPLASSNASVRQSIPNPSMTSSLPSSIAKEVTKKRLKPVCDGDTYRGVFVHSVPHLGDAPPRTASATQDDFRVFDISSPTPSPALLPTKGLQPRTKPDAPPVVFARVSPRSSRRGSIGSLPEDLSRPRPPSATMSMDSTGGTLQGARRPPMMRSVANARVSPTVPERLERIPKKAASPLRKGGPKAPPRGLEPKITSLEEARKMRRMQRDALSTPTVMNKLVRLQGARQWAPGEGRRVQRGSQDFKGARRARLNSSPIAGF